MNDLKDKAIGCFIGLAVGDALGAPVQSLKPGNFPPVTEMLPNPHFNTPAGYWTDDTSMAICLCESLVECKGFDPQDQLARYLSWLTEGYNSSTDEAFDIGRTTLLSLTNYGKTGDLVSPYHNSHQAGNGSIMRLAPLSIYYRNDPRAGIYYAGESSKTTHSNKEAVDGCRLLAALTIGILQGDGKETVLAPGYAPRSNVWEEDPLHPHIDAISQGSWRNKSAQTLSASGYVVDTLEAALWGFGTTDSFEEGMTAVVNLGNDADTTGAVYGQLAGAYYGLEAIPERWLNALAKKDVLTNHVKQLITSPIEL